MSEVIEGGGYSPSEVTEGVGSWSGNCHGHGEGPTTAAGRRAATHGGARSRVPERLIRRYDRKAATMEGTGSSRISNVMPIWRFTASIASGRKLPL